MSDNEIVNILIDKVCEVCRVSREHVLADIKLPSVVRARVLIVQFLRRIGMTNDSIATIVLQMQGEDATITKIKNKAKVINKMFNAYAVHRIESYSFCLASAEIAKFCRDEYMKYYEPDMKSLPKSR